MRSGLFFVDENRVKTNTALVMFNSGIGLDRIGRRENRPTIVFRPVGVAK
jgi:hypothetical protein